MKSCVVFPSKGRKTYKELTQKFGHELGSIVFLKAIHPQFIEDFKDTLILNDEGVPSSESILSTSFMKKFIGEEQMILGYEKDFKQRDDTAENYKILLTEAMAFNRDSNHQNYIATVENIENKLKIAVNKKTPELVQKFRDQYSSLLLNEKLSNIFSPLGVTVYNLAEAEIKAGRTGVIEFSHAKEMANGFSSMIRVANNMEGTYAISEEFSHLIVGLMKDKTLVSRALKVLESNEKILQLILGNEYKDTLEYHDNDLSLVAEEALGKLLQDKMKNMLEIDGMPSSALMHRSLKSMIAEFVDYDDIEVEKAIIEVDSAIDDLAKNILSSNIQFTKEEIMSIDRTDSFNDLSDRIQRNIDILKKASKTELKRARISNDRDKQREYKNLSDELDRYMQDDLTQTTLGILKYAHAAINHLKTIDSRFRNLNFHTDHDRFAFLRLSRQWLDSYAGFIEDLNAAFTQERVEDDDMFMREFTESEEFPTLKSMISELRTLSAQVTSDIEQASIPLLTEFYKPFVGEIIVPFGKEAGKTITIESLLTKFDKDISFKDRWLDSMADSSETLLQVIDKVVKSSKGKARLKSINDIKEIQSLMLKCEKMGITSFEWMFEKDSKGNKSGDYISETNIALYKEDLENFKKELNDRYGEKATGENARQKVEELQRWHSTHSKKTLFGYVPNESLYRNKDFDNLNTNQKQILEEFLAIKNRFDSQLPATRVSKSKAIQIRKSDFQRKIDELKSPSTIIESIKENISSTFQTREDDDALFGDITKRGLTNFDNTEYLELPVLYTNRLSNPNELSTDVFSSLMQYAYMANTYQAMEEVIDPLEVLRQHIKTMKVGELSGNAKVIEKIKVLGKSTTNDVIKPATETNIWQKLNDFYNSQIYGRYLKDSGDINIPLLNKKLNLNKAANWLLKYSSIAQLGGNFLANSANVATGVGMQNIEAISGDYFTMKELASADTAYAAALASFLPEVGARVKTNKLALFDELFDIKQEYGKNNKNTKKKGIVERLFNSDIAFIGQEAGDHWLYNRTAIAMAKRKKVLLGGIEMSLWDALEVEDSPYEGIKQLNNSRIKELDGSDLDIEGFSREVGSVNQKLFGIYNQEDMNAASTVAMGRLLLQYRKWIIPSLNKRFRKGQTNLMSSHSYEEGYYVTLARITQGLIKGQYNLPTIWDSLEEEEKTNIKKALFELCQFMLIFGLAYGIEWPDDKDRSRWLKYLEYMTKRTAHELGGLTPAPITLYPVEIGPMVNESLKTVQQPLPSLSAINNIIKLTNSILNPEDWTKELQSGPYKGLTVLEKNFICAPIPVVAQYKQIDGFVNGLDNKMLFYARGNTR